MPMAIVSPGLIGAGRVRLKMVSAIGADVAVGPFFVPGWGGTIWPGSKNDMVHEKLVRASMMSAASREKAECEMDFMTLLLQSKPPSASVCSCPIYDTSIFYA